MVRIEEETIGYATAEKVPGAIARFPGQPANEQRAAKPAISAPQRGNWRRRDQGLPRLLLRWRKERIGFSGLAAEPGAERRERDGETRRLRRGLLSDAA